MKINLRGEISQLLQGIQILSEEKGFEVAVDGLPIKVEKLPFGIEVSLENGQGYIGYTEKIHFFRALGLFIEAVAEKDSFKINEVPQFTLNGAMIDVSRNAVLKVDSVKNVIRKMALMGLNTIMLYAEDTYEVKDRPYFGYMRGRYTEAELKECDDYADIFGIEIIPCIQTLAHLTEALKWSYASEIKDTADILLAGEEKTYEFIEDMIKAASAPFRSKRIHIGMDEAHNLGLGKYLDLNGYRRRFDIMNGHLERVVGITEKYGLKPMIWSDMYFRLASKNGEYYDKDAVIPEDVMEKCHKGVQLVYWDYYHNDEDTYTEFIKRHKKFGNGTVFAGGVWTWNGIVTNYNKTFVTTNAALSSCKKEGIKEVFATMWGDNGAETNFFSALLGLQLYAEHGYAAEVDDEKLRKRFKFCTGGNYDSFMDLNLLDFIPDPVTGNINIKSTANPSKFLLWQDVLIGLFDKELENYDLHKHYALAAEKLNGHLSNNEEWSFVFQFAHKLAHALTIKADLGIRLKKCYDNKDSDGLNEILLKELPELYTRLSELRLAHKEQWFRTNKPFGWEVIDIRYGGLLARIDTAISRLSDYIADNVDKLEELEEERLNFNGSDAENIIYRHNQYSRIVTASPLG